MAGGTNPDAYKINPAADAKVYTQLAAVLTKTEIKKAADAYNTQDALAIDRQSEFKKWIRGASIAVFVTAVFNAAVLACSAWAVVIGEVWAFKSLLVLSILGVVSGGTAASYLAKAKGRDVVGRWMTSRAKAEALRISYYETVMAHDQGDGKTLDQVLSRFTYYCDRLLTAQRKYFQDRGNAHDKAADRTVTLMGWAAALAIAGPALAAMTSPGLGSQFASFAALGVVGAALTNLATVRETVNQDDRNAKRYAATGERLADIEAKRDKVESAIRSGKYEPIQAFTAAVREVLTTELREWMEAKEARNAAIDHLNADLEKAIDQKAAAGGAAKPKAPGDRTPESSA